MVIASRFRGANLGLAVAVLALAACASVEAPPPASGSSSKPAKHCPAIAGIDQVLAPGQLLLLGEAHGTNEVPAFVASLVCAARAAGLALSMGLEIPRSEAGRLAEFLSSDGSDASASRLVGGEFWTSRYQDGRRSVAMLALLEELRRLRAGDAGRAVTVAALDLPEVDYAGGDRDAAMAEGVRQLRAADPKALVVVLTGNVHNRMVAGFGDRPDYRPMGLLLADLSPLSLNMASIPGEAWVCMPECGVHPWGGGAQSTDLGILAATTAPAGSAWHGSFSVGKLTPSPPAVAGAN